MSATFGIDCSHDYTNEFTTHQIFESKVALLQWIRITGKKNNCVIVIERSDSANWGNKKRRPKIRFCCERSGKYREFKRKIKMGVKNNLKPQVDIDKSNEKRPRLTATKKCQCPFKLIAFNIGANEWILEVACGVHNHMGFGRKHWRKVRTDLMNELKGMPDLYEGLFGGQSTVEQLHHRLNHFASNIAPRGKWMDLLDMGHLIATCYGVLVVNLSDGQCLTFLPLREYIDGKLMKADIREIGIGFVNGNHFVQICFVPGHPLPPVPPNWIHYADNTAKILYQKYQLRFQQYIQLPHPERAANISSKIMVLDDDETAQFGDVIMPSEDTTIHLGDN